MTVYLIDLQVRADECPDDDVRNFLEEKGIEVLGCCGNVDSDYDAD